jgi:hypothetical protein
VAMRIDRVARLAFLQPNSRNLAFLKCGWRHKIRLPFWLFSIQKLSARKLHTILFLNHFPLRKIFFG